MKTILITYLLISITIISFANDTPETAKGKIYNAYINNDQELWKLGLVQLSNEYRATGDINILYDLAQTQYGYIGYCFSIKDKKTAEQYIDKLDIVTRELSRHQEYKSEASALTGAVIAFRIALKPAKAIYLGQKSLEYIDKAVELDNNDPTAWIEKANSNYHTPAIFGGSYKDAIKNYKTAVKLLEQDINKYEGHWIYIHTLTWLAKSYEENSDLLNAKKTYEKILNIAPDFQWVKNELYPDLIKKLS